MHFQPPLFAFSTAAFFVLALCAFWCILRLAAFWILMHYDAFWCILIVRFILVHSWRGAYATWSILLHFDAFRMLHFYALLIRCIYKHSSAFIFSCILTQMHFIAFTRLTWSDAFCRHDAFWSGYIYMYSLAFWRIRYRAHHTMCIQTHSNAF